MDRWNFVLLKVEHRGEIGAHGYDYNDWVQAREGQVLPAMWCDEHKAWHLVEEDNPISHKFGLEDDWVHEGMCVIPGDGVKRLIVGESGDKTDWVDLEGNKHKKDRCTRLRLARHVKSKDTNSCHHGINLVATMRRTPEDWILIFKYIPRRSHPYRAGLYWCEEWLDMLDAVDFVIDFDDVESLLLLADLLDGGDDD